MLRQRDLGQCARGTRGAPFPNRVDMEIAMDVAATCVTWNALGFKRKSAPEDPREAVHSLKL
jgi:hypothetical protein